MDDLLIMQILHRQHDLREDIADFLLGEGLFGGLFVETFQKNAGIV